MELLNTILKNKRAAGVEFIFQPDGKLAIHCLLLKKKKGKVVVESSSLAENILKLKEIISSDVPVHVSFNGKGSIHKKVSLTENEVDKALLNKVLPNANADDFYLQKTNISQEEAYISVIRKETVDAVIREMGSAGINVVRCSFGPFSINAVLPLLNNSSSQYDLKFSGNVLSIVNGKIDEYKLADTNGAGEIVQVGPDQVQGNKLVAFSLALQHFIGDESDADIPLVKNARGEYEQKQLFKAGGKAVLAFFFIALMLNFFLFTHFAGSYNALNEKVQKNTVLLAGLDKMKHEIGEKQNFLEQTGLLDASRTSFYADRLSMDIPASIRLSGLNINPLVKKNVADDNELDFTPHNMQVSGSCDKSTELNEWIKKIRQKDWVKEVIVLNYTQAQSKSEGEFSLEINIK